MFLSYKQVTVNDAVQDKTPFGLTGKETSVVLQAEGGSVRFTMDGTTLPTHDIGFLLLTTTLPIEFLIEDFSRIKFIKATGAAGAVKLNAHFVAGRNI